MSIRIKPLVAALTGLLAAPSIFAVDITGVHDLAVKNDPQLQAAMYRREASNENRALARSSLLPTLTASASSTRGDSTTTQPATQVSNAVNFSSDTDNESLRLELRQSLYDPANYKRLDIAKVISGRVQHCPDHTDIAANQSNKNK